MIIPKEDNMIKNEFFDKALLHKCDNNFLKMFIWVMESESHFENPKQYNKFKLSFMGWSLKNNKINIS